MDAIAETTTITLNEEMTERLREVGQIVADVRPDLNHQISDTFVVHAGVALLSMLFTPGFVDKFGLETTLAAAFTAASQMEG